MILSLALAIGGLVVLLVAAEIMIRGAVGGSRILKISPHVIGLTVIAFGTSAPELFVSMKAALHGHDGIAIGNVVGSNIANILLMIGTVGVIYPFASGDPALRRDGFMLLLSTVVFVLLCNAGMIERWHGAVMLTVLFGYLYYCYREDRKVGACGEESVHAKEVEEFDSLPDSMPKAALYTVIGLVGVAFGAKLLVDGAVDVARLLGVSETVIGITMVALGTSMPELATTIVAAVRRHNDVALGNIIGSNIFNTLGILGAVALVKPIGIPQEIMEQDLWVMVAVTVVFITAALSLRTLGRPLAVLFFIGYGLFIVGQFTSLTPVSLAGG
ncbi:calcium/sodium antiporter [Nisaea acidiphila]|uniref:Calcium/sodium antiporter n=1 Tax=Nisaea acidiphila TaxID=1862145 RepID=A0A9J7APN1_9PROT|nr:calcium/sodium antiporter [Nisaea acidiphila]UUX49118.1 calcium/sodium antiporter [Nisaea acidiphila]